MVPQRCKTKSKGAPGVLFVAFMLRRLYQDSKSTGMNSQRFCISQQEQDPSKRILPISLGIPESRFKYVRNQTWPAKNRDFAHIIPNVKRTYIYNTEDDYYDSYSDAYFGITFKKGGWDAMRHYEIIASGSIPYFTDIERVPYNVLHDFPVDLIKEAMRLPGVPFVSEVMKHISNGSTTNLRINHHIFNVSAYTRLLTKIVMHSKDHLTWSGRARYVLRMMNEHYPCMGKSTFSPRVLLVTIQECEYMSCVMFGGFYELLGNEKMSSLLGAKTALFRSYKTTHLYGKGYSFANTYDFWNESARTHELNTRLENGFFNVIIFFNGANRFCNQKQYFGGNSSKSKFLYDYQQKFNPLVVVVDGNDINGCHDFFLQDDNPLEYHLHFIREFRDTLRRPANWTGCDC